MLSLNQLDIQFQSKKLHSDNQCLSSINSSNNRYIISLLSSNQFNINPLSSIQFNTNQLSSVKYNINQLSTNSLNINLLSTNSLNINSLNMSNMKKLKHHKWKFQEFRLLKLNIKHLN
jgi:hypothetical protein